MATAINDFIQGIIMIVGICAVIVSILNGQGGFYSAVTELAKIPSDIPVTEGMQGGLHGLFRSGPLKSSGSCDTDVAWNLGTSPDGTEILCHQG